MFFSVTVTLLQLHCYLSRVSSVGILKKVIYCSSNEGQIERTKTKTAGFGMNIWLKISEGIDEIEPLGILDDVSTIVNYKMWL